MSPAWETAAGEAAGGEATPVPGRFVHIHYHRPPDRTQVYVQRLLAVDDGALVTLARDLQFDPPMRIDGQVALERGSVAIWFTFPDTWHDIGIFHRADGSVSGIYANVLTPPVLSPLPGAYRWDTTDLYLDVWMPTGAGHKLLDQDEFESALEAGLMEPAVASRARAEGDTLLEGLATGAWPPAVVGDWSLDRALRVEAELVAAGAPRAPEARDQ